MPLDNEKLKKVYAKLKEGGYKDDYGTFIEGFTGNENYGNRKQVYDLLTQNGAQIGKNYADFMQRLYTPSPKQAPSPKQTQTQTQQPRVNRGSMVRAVTDPLNTRGIGGVMQNINKVQGVVKKAEKEKANGYQPRFDGVTKRNTEAKIPTLADLKPMPTFEPAPHFDTEERVGTDGKIVSKAKLKQIFDGSGQPKYVYQDSFTGKTYDPSDSDPHTQEMIKRGKDAASYVREAPTLKEVTDNDLVGLASSIDKRMHEIALQRNAEAGTSDWSGLDMPRGGGALVGNWYTSTQNGLLADEEYKTLGIAQGALARAHKMVEEAEKSKREGNFSGFIKGAGRGFVDGVFDPETWGFGVSSLAEAGYIKNALDKFDSGQQLSKEDKILLDAKAMEMAVDAFYGSDLGRGYKAGKVTAEAIPFMIEMMVNPASGAGKSAASMLTRYALKRFGKKGLVKASKKAAEKAFVRAEERALAKGLSEAAAKAAGKRAAARATTQTLKFKAAKIGARMLGDVAGASTMAATTGAVRTAADAVSRHSGNVKFDVDNKGHIVFAGHDKGDDWGTAVKKAFANTAIENYSEMFGAYFAPIGSFVGKAGEKLLSKLGLGKVTEMLGKLSSSDIAKAIKRIEEKGQFNGVIGEGLEEQVGGIMNALIVGDQTLDTADGTGVFNTDNQIDTFLGVGLMGGIFSAARLGGGFVGGKLNLEARRAVRQAGVAAREDFKGKELIWDKIKSDVDNASNDQLKQVVKNIVTDGGLSDDNKKAALQYVRSSMHLRGFEAIRPLTKEEEEADAHNVQEEAVHNRGFEADAQERKDIAIESADPDNAEAQQAWAGVEQRIDDDATRMADAFREKSLQMQHNDGSFHTATLKEKDEHGEGKQVFIVSGHVQMTPDGTMIDREASDKTIVIFDPSTGERKMIDPSSDFGLSSVDEPTTPEELEASIERERQGFIQAQLDEARGTIRLSVGQQFVLPDGNEAVVVALDESGEDITAMLADGTQVNIQRAELQQAHDEQAIAEYRQRKGIEEPTAEDEESEQPEQSEQVEQGAQVEGAPSSYEPDMELVLPNERGGESRAMVMGRVRYEGGQFIPDENGGIVEYYMDGEVRHEQISKLNDRVVAYTDAAQVVEEETPPAEDIQAEEEAPLQEEASVPKEDDTTLLDKEEPAPAAEEDAEEDNEMPMRDNGEEDWQATTPERAHSYIFNEAGLSQREGNEFVAAQKDAAQRALNKAKSEQAPRVGTSIGQYKKAKAKHQEKIENAQRVLDYWNAVQDIQVEIQHKEREQKEAEDAKAHEEAAAQMQAEFEARKAARAEAMERRKAESIQEDGDSGTSIVGVQDGAEQINVLKENEDPQGKGKNSPDRNKPQSRIQSFIDEWERLKKEGDAKALEHFSRTINIALNGYAQARGVEEEFKQLRAEIDEYAKAYNERVREKRKANSANDSAENKETPTDFTPSPRKEGEDVIEDIQAGDGYSIEPTNYTNKKGKTTPMHLVRFERKLSKEEIRAGKEIAKESRGWWDSKQGGFMMRSEEAAKALAESLSNEEAVQDAQPLSVEDMAAVSDHALVQAVDDAIKVEKKEQPTVQYDYDREEEVYDKVLSGLRDALNNNVGSIPNIKAIEKQIRDLRRRIKTVENGLATTSADNVAQGFDALALLTGRMKAYEQFLSDLRKKMRETERDDALAAHGVKIGDKVLYNGNEATIYDADERQVILDTGSAPVMYEATDWGNISVQDAESKPKEKEDKKPKSKWVDDEDAERFEELRKRLKQKLRGQLNIGVDPEILTIGIEMSYLVLKNGARKFKDFAEQLLGAVGEEVRPYLKAFYNGARDLPEMSDYAKELTPYDEVRTFDVKNFDKEGAKDIVDTAEYIVREQEAERDAKEVSNKLKEERNERRKESEQQIATNTTSTTNNLKGRYTSEADIEGAFKKTFVDKETGAELTVGKFTSPHKVAIKINGDVSIVEWRHLANMLNKGKWQEKTSHDLHDSNIEDNVIVKSHDEVNGEKVGTQEENTSKESGKDKKDVSLQQPTPHIIGGLFDDDIRQKKNERNDGSRESHSSIGTRREELSSSDKVGTGASVQDPARDSQGQRRRLGISSTESGTRPQYDVNRKYSNEEINDIVSSVTEIRDGKVVITDNVSDDIRAIARQYVSGGIAKDGRGVLDEYYTDGEIVDAVASLIAPLLPKGRRLRVLEPSVGVGNFIAAVPKSSTSEVVTFEINETTARIAKILHPDIEVNVRSFETEFIDDEGNKKPVRSEYDVVIGNPPYGAHRGIYKGLGEESKIARYEDYFVKRSLDVLSDGGVLAMVLPSSWLDRQKQAKGYNVVRAYRLPSGAFAGTKIGTDIVVLRKKDGAAPTDVSRYFDAHPERVLGVEKERKGRFGRQERYIDGDIDTALSAIQRDDAIDVAKELGLPHDTDTLNDVESAIEEAGSVDGGKSIVQAEEKEKRAAKGETPKKRSSKGVGNGIKLTLKKGGEIVPASVHFQTTFSESEIEAFEDTYYDGTIENWKDHIEHVSYHNGSYLNDFYYADGDIYARLAQLERDKDYIVNTHGQAQYEKQRSMLERVLPKPKGIDEISITPNTSFVHNLRIGGEHSLERMFLDFLHELPHEAFGGSSAWEVGGYVRNEQVYGNDKHHNQLVRDRRKKVGDALFKRFLKEELSESMRGIVLNAFNREYNGTYRPDYSQVPMFSQLRKEFHGKTLKLTKVQLAGVGRSTVKGVGVLAHEVGFGKTLSGVLAMQEAMTRGNARKPLIVVPNDNIMHQWIETIEEAAPESIVNVLGNLGTKYDLTDFVVNDGEYSIVTYEGLKAMSFSDKTYSELANNFSYITDELEAHKSQRDIEKAKAKHQELAGRMKRGSKKNYSFEDFGFDYLTFDEVHNANHIVEKVKLDSSEYSDFRAQNQRSSDLGIKTWMAAQYIQAHNNGRNVLLLSATPFTNKPLEYYSILSLVANDMLKRKGFYKIDEFFKTFMEADNELEINAAGKPVRKTNVRRFRNNGLFQALLGEYIDIKGEDDNPDLVRPDRHNKEYKLPQNELTQKAMDSVQDMLADSDTLLQGIGSARQVAFSPYSVLGIPNDYKTFVENSPKIDATMKLIKQNKKDFSDAGQIIYSEVCVDTFPLIKEYLVREIGYKDSEVRIITGATSNAERLKIQEAFNTGDVKVVIGSPAIKEGLNLQGNTTDMYILSLPWNFTQLRQIEGRGWRQGNRWKNIRINYMLTEDSADVFMLQRLQTKQELYNEAMKKGVESVDVSDIDTTELKSALIKNPATRADIIVQEEFARLNDEKIRLESEASFVERKCKDYKELDERRKSLERLIAHEKNDPDSFLVQSLTSSLEAVNIKIEQEREKLREKGVDLESVDKKLSVINERIDAIKQRMSKESRDARMEQLTAQFTNEAESHANGATVDDYIKERAKENAAGYYELRKTESEDEAKYRDQGEDTELPARDRGDAELKRDTAEQLAEKLHTPVNVVEDANEITHPNKEIEARRRKAKGWYNVSTGEVVVVLANHKDAADVAATISHEVIAHKGLRELVGEAHYDEFLDEVYDHLSGDLKREIDDAAGRAFLNDINKSGDDVRDYKRHRRIAVDELFGSLAEKPFDEFSESERNLWQKIKEFAKKLLDRFLDKLKLPKWFELGDNELRYILWRSKERLERGKEDPIDQARDIVKREELGLTNEPLNKVSVTARNFEELSEQNEWNPKPIRGEEMVDLYDIAPKVTTHDYYLGTKADFKLVKSADDVRDAWEKLKQQDGFRYVHSPKSDSEYLVNDETGEIYRMSDHWGWVASCRWSIDDQAPSGFNIGKANIKDFERIKGSYVFTPEAQRREPGHETHLRAKENLERALKDDTYKFTAAARRLAEEKVRSHQSNAEFYEQNHESGDIVYRRNEFGKYIPYREMKHSREQWFEGYISDEEREIVERAQADGSYMKAPNGKPSNLNGKQWAQVRTKAFKKWFGDWEKAARIALTEIEKGKLLDQINDQAVDNGFMSTGAEPNPSVAIGKDTKAVSILQGNSSKVVDENGEPQVIRSVDDKHMGYFLNIRHPLEVPEDVVVSEIADKAVKEGYDGVHTPKEYIPFTVNQYKSAQRNNGEFSTESDDVLYRDSGETRDIWLDQSMGLQERTTAAAARLANNHRDNKVFMQDAMRAIGANLTDLRKAMRLQKDFDRTTAKRVYDLARILMEMGYLRGLNQQEVSKLLSVMKNSIGKQNIDNDVQKLMDLMVDHQLKQSKSTLESLEHIKGSKVNAKGVEVQGALDAEGQAIMAAMKAAKDIVTPCAGKTEEDNGELTAWGHALEDVQERMGSEDNAIAENAALEYQGMLLAQQWFDEIKQRELEEASLRQELNHAPSTTPAEERKSEAYKEYIGNLKQAIQQNKIDRAQAYMNLVGRLTESLRDSIEGAKAFKLREKARISAIQRDANLDMEGRPAGEHYVPDWKARAVNNAFVSGVTAPLATMDQMLRLFGNKSANGEGYLYNRFERGFVDARQKEIKGYREKTAILDAKAAEIFGGKIKTWADLIRYVSGLPDKEVVFKNDGIDERFTLSQGNLMYIYMVNKMLDGRLKLSKMGLTSDVVEELTKEIDPRLIKLADWMQEDFLVQTRNEYNETHKRVFGASMAAIENYFPLKIRSNARIDKAEDLDNPTRNSGISTTTGSIIKRRRNSLPLDLLNADALNIILGHITEMEHWNAFVEYNRDLNTLRTYKRFRNGVENMTTIYGSGKELWKLFNDLCQITTGSYIPPREDLDKSLVNLAKGVTAAKVSFRLFTALKQFLSFPAYFPEVRAVHIAKCLAHPKESWDWCMENLPIFNERWNSRLSGDPRLLKTNMDWKMWRTRAAEIAMRIGMTPNAFVDALTVCIGARAMYMTRKGQYLRDGYTEEEADKRAKQDAEILYNQTQQSSEGAFLSKMQVDRGWISVLFSIFRNSSMAYTRQVYDAMRNLRRNLTPGGRKKSIAFMTKQYMNEGFDKAKAEENAKRKFDRQIRKDILRVATFGYLLQFAWNLGAYLPYMLFGGDDDEKEVFWQDVFAHSYFGALEGLTGGDVISQVLGSYFAGNLNPNSMDKDMPLTSDLALAFKEFAKGDKDAALSNMINLIVQSGIGVNPQSITDSVLAIMDACGDDPALANEATIFIARILQVPQSQIDKLYFDEVGLMGSGLSKYTPAQLAERYARYKVKRGHFSTPWAWNDDVNIGKAMTKANKEIKERTNHMGLTNLNEAFAPYEEVYQKVDKQMKDYEAAKKTDYVKAANMMVEIQKDKSALDTYRKLKSMDSQLDKMAKRFLSAKSNGERQLYKKMIESYKPAMLKVLQAKGEAAQEKAMDDIGTLMEGFADEQEKLYENQ